MSGYIKLNRKFFDNFLWNEARVYSKAEAWLDLIQSARFEASTEIINGKVIELQRGELPASRRFLELRWGWGSTKVSNFLKILTDLRMVNQRQTNGQTIVTLVKYGVYNDLQTTDKPPTVPPANHGQTTGKPPANQNKEEEEEIKEDNPPVSPKGEHIDCQKIVDLYHSSCPDMPAVSTLSDSRKKMIKARVNEFGKQKVAEMLQRAGKSRFLSGDSDRKWKANLDWLMKPANFVKVLDGCYDTKDSKFRNCDVKEYDNKL